MATFAIAAGLGGDAVVPPFASCSFSLCSFQQSFTSWLHILQWVHCFFGLSPDLSFEPFPFLVIFAKNVLALVPDSCTRCCSSRAIWDIMFSVVMSEGLVLERIFFKVPIEGGREDMMANVMSLSSTSCSTLIAIQCAFFPKMHYNKTGMTPYARNSCNRYIGCGKMTAK